jgi:hypothetical protein
MEFKFGGAWSILAERKAFLDSGLEWRVCRISVSLFLMELGVLFQTNNCNPFDSNLIYLVSCISTIIWK